MLGREVFGLGEREVVVIGMCLLVDSSVRFGFVLENFSCW